METTDGEQWWKAQVPEAINRPGRQDQHYAIYGLKADVYRRTRPHLKLGSFYLESLCGLVIYGLEKIDWLGLFFFRESRCLFPANDNG